MRQTNGVFRTMAKSKDVGIYSPRSLLFLDRCEFRVPFADRSVIVDAFIVEAVIDALIGFRFLGNQRKTDEHGRNQDYNKYKKLPNISKAKKENGCTETNTQKRQKTAVEI